MFYKRSSNVVTKGRKPLITGTFLVSLIVLSGCNSSGSDVKVPVDDGPAPIMDSGPDDGSTTVGTPDEGSDTGGAETLSSPVVPEITSNRILGPLPTPSSTPAPGPDSEPVRSTGPVTTVREFFVVRDPVRDLDDNFATLTDADFAAGPLPAITHIPAGLDTSKNSPPYFDNLLDVEVFAGEELNVVLRPLDVDGGIPGLFPYGIPQGARYVDNFDGTRSLIWRPFQPHVGIREFTITATDPVEPFYRTERTIRIKVKMPSDPESITNLAPVIHGIRPHTLRVNDPVTLYIRVSDPNGTISELEIANPPAGATIVPHYSDPEISILRFIPRTAETLSLDLSATDADDSSLTISSTITLDVLDEDDFILTGSRLRDLAGNHDLLIGYAALQDFYERPDGALYADIAAAEFNIVSTENSLKWDFVNPLPGKFRWAQSDNLVQHAKARRQAVHGHTLVWHRQLPGWVTRSALADREVHMREYIHWVLTRYRDDIPIWDVVNEALEEDGTLRNSTWYQAMGGDFIDIAFRQARLSAPDATLLYNDYDVSFAGPKSDGLVSLMTDLKDAGTPVNGVGFQMHLDADFDRSDEVAATFQKIADLDLDIYITELDVSIRAGMSEDEQADVYEDVLSVCLAQPRCKAYQAWGFTDMYSWRKEYDPLLLDRRYQAKPAYFALQRRLSEN